MGTRRTAAAIVGAGLLLTSIAGVAPSATADGRAATKGAKVPAIDISATKSAVKPSATKVAPGPVQFSVKKAYKRSTIDILATDNINKVVSLIPKLQDEGAAAAVTKLNKLVTIYGGSTKGGAWQADLPKGNYYALNIDAAYGGDTIAAKFKVKGKASGATMHKAGASLAGRCQAG